MQFPRSYNNQGILLSLQHGFVASVLVVMHIPLFTQPLEASLTKPAISEHDQLDAQDKARTSAGSHERLGLHVYREGGRKGEGGAGLYSSRIQLTGKQACLSKEMRRPTVDRRHSGPKYDCCLLLLRPRHVRLRQLRSAAPQSMLSSAPLPRGMQPWMQQATATRGFTLALHNLWPGLSFQNKKTFPTLCLCSISSPSAFGRHESAEICHDQSENVA